MIVEGPEPLHFEVADEHVGERLDKFLSRAVEPLGLALSRSLVEMHGGTLKIESTEGVGTRVTISLPV